MNHLVSLLIPVYNRAGLVGQAVRSALTQTYPHLEILIHDNASDDGTWELIQQFRSDPRVQLFHAPHNRGMLGAWNYLLKKARGQYIKYLASDDLLAPDCVTREAMAFASHPRAALVTCRRHFLNAATNSSSYHGFAMQDTIHPGRAYAHDLLTTLRENKIGEPTAVMFRRRLVPHAGLFDPRFSQYADFEYWVRILEYGDLVYLHAPLCTFRTHAGSSTTSAIADGRFITETYQIIDKYYSSPRYRRVFGLTGARRRAVTRLKTLDFLKNIKDLFLSGNFPRAARYSQRLLSGYLTTL